MKSKPVVAFVDELFIEICETSEIVPNSQDDSSTSSSKGSAKYGFTDRILDSLSFEINKVYIGFRTLGKMKTKAVGPWTPPVLFVELLGNKYVSTNHLNVEADLDSCFRIRGANRPILFVYKRFISRSVNLFLVDPESWPKVVHEILSDTKLSSNKDFFQYISQLQKNKKFFPQKRGYVIQKIISKAFLEIPVCMRKRMDNHMMLGLELSFIIREINVCLRQLQFAELMHLIVGVYYSFLRRDAVEVQYGANPHSENLVQEPSKKVSNQDRLLSKLAVDVEGLEREFISNAFVRANDNRLKEIGIDEDPPHLRLILILQIDSMKLQLPLDSLSTDVSASPENDVKKCSALCGVTLSCQGLVYSTIWPANASITESSKQISLKYFSISGYKGMANSTLLRSRESLDDNGQPLFLQLQPRGVREYDDLDMEFTPGTSIIYKSDYNWPPPPINQGVSVSTEICISPIEITLDMEILLRLYTFVMGAWDSRWGSGDWRTLAEFRQLTSARLSSTHGNVSGACVIVLSSIDFIVFPNKLLSQGNKSSLPAEYKVKLGLTSLVWRHSLDITLEAVLYGRQKTSEDTPINGDSQFHSEINQDSDLSEGLVNLFNRKKSSRYDTTTDLISPRFEASVSEILVCVSVNDSFSQTSDSAHSKQKSKKSEPLWKSLVKVDAAVFFSSLDPYPSEDRIPASQQNTTNGPINPYNREYYWREAENTVLASYFKIENTVIESSLVDLVYVLETTALIKEILDLWLKDEYKRISEKEMFRRARTEIDTIVTDSDKIRFEMQSRASRLYSLNLANVKLQVVDSAVNYFDVIASRNFQPSEFSVPEQKLEEPKSKKKLLALDITSIYLIRESDHFENDDANSFTVNEIVKGAMGHVTLSMTLDDSSTVEEGLILSVASKLDHFEDFHVGNKSSTCGFRWTKTSKIDLNSLRLDASLEAGDFSNANIMINNDTTVRFNLRTGLLMIKSILPAFLLAIW